MPYTKLWVHTVWSVKERQPLLNKNVRQPFFQHIKEYAREKDIYIDNVNGYLEHVHALIGLKPKESLADIMHLLKGASSHWFNQQGFINQKLTWQSNYYAATVSPTHLDSVRGYIKNQEEHHKQVSFQEEVERFIRVNGLE